MLDQPDLLGLALGVLGLLLTLGYGLEADGQPIQVPALDP
jgi:hypothetical protein